MKLFRAKHDTLPESPVRTLYGRKGTLLLLPLDVCILQVVNGGTEEFRPLAEPNRLNTAPIQEEGGGRIGLILSYDWPPKDHAVNPVVTVQLAPSANHKGIPDVRVFAALVEVGDAILIEDDNGSFIAGTIHALDIWCAYPDLTHRVRAHRAEFSQHLSRRAHGSAVTLVTGELVGMLIATQNQSGGTCRVLIYST